MNITELDSYNLADAVKFHNRLNPKIWGRDEHLLPEVRQKLLEIAADFQEFLGIDDLAVEDITVSGSNAAYSYTPHSDIDLHLVVRMPEQADEVYQELFNAKKYQYNDLMDIKIHGADVELYVQPADEAPVSLGEYSIKNNDWIQVPRKKRAKIDHSIVKHKYEDIKARIESALKEDDSDRVQALIDKIKEMRRAGLDAHGEFGAENLAFKMLRSQGWIKKLYDHRAATRARELSLKEQDRPRSVFRWGFGSAPKKAAPELGYKSYFKATAPKDPNELVFKSPQEYEHWLAQRRKEKVPESHQGHPYSSEDGVAPTTAMFVTEDDSTESIVQDFIRDTAERLGIESMPNIELHSDDNWSVEHHSFGMYEPESHTLHVNLNDRHILDILRTVAHELAHCRQNELSALPDDAGKTGSPWEDEAHAVAGEIMRDYADANPDRFNDGPVTENASGYIPKNKKEAQDPRYKMAVTVDVKPGQVGKEANKLALKTGKNGEPTLLMKSANLLEYKLPQPSQGQGKFRDLNEPLGPEFKPTMPRGTVRVDVSDVYDWYKLGKHISNLDQADASEFGKGPPSTIVSFGDEDTEHKYIKGLEKLGLTTTDIDPADPKKPQGMKRQKVDPTYNVAEALTKELQQFKEQDLFEIKMSPSNLRQEAAKTGAQAGMEFEMIVPNIAGETEPEYEPDYDMDQRSRSFEDIRDFFYDGDYNSRRDVDNLIVEMGEQFAEWQDEQIMNSWDEEGFELLKEYIKDNDYFDDDEAREEATNALQAEYGDDITPEDFEKMLEAIVSEKFDEFVQDQWDNQGQFYDEAREQYIDEQRGENDESDWLDEHYPYMTDVQNNFDISWPYYTNINDSDGEITRDDLNVLADDFSDAVGMPVNASLSYHGGRREPGTYVIEPDGSLEPDDSDDYGLEFVSPPMPIDQMIDQLNKVRDWAGRNGCYTNKSTGLHINISVPDYDLSKLDYVKLALLLGDEYVLKNFGRSSNTYAKSALGKIRDILRRSPDKGQEVLAKMKDHMEDLATKAIHSGTTDKYTSINTKSGYIEFRSPGGDWLDANFDKVETTLLRFTVALSAAMNPQAYREEYLKKLYRLLSETGSDKNEKDTIKYFADYVAGKMPRSALASFVRQAQLERKVKRGETGGEQMWWRVSNPQHSYGEIEVVANSKQEAIEKALGPDGYPSWANTRQSIQAVPVRPFDTSAVKAQVGEPQAIGRQSGPTLNGRPSNPDGGWVISPENDRSRVVYRFAAASFDDANIVRRQWAADNEGVWIVQRDPSRTLGQPQSASRTPATTGVTQAPQTADQAQGGLIDVPIEIPDTAPRTSTAPGQPQQQFTGNWLILDPEGNVIHRFGGIGNAQSDANRVAMAWLRRNPRHMQHGVEIAPEMA